ncbi:MAG: hypothetical protein LC134_08715 [Chitinophagales bacterium]|nr:hypothetical protein [Chitinophagales bacterium]
MKNVFLVIAMIFTFFISYGQSQTWVNGYYKSNGTYVQGHWRQKADNTNHNNWSTTQQTNPYTGQTGTRAKDYSSQANNYGAGKTIHTGPRGGQYYYNSKGRKVYVPKRR